MKVVTTLLKREDIEEYAALCALTFLDNAAYSALFAIADEEDKQRAFHWLFLRRISITLDAGGSFFLARENDEKGRILGGVGVFPPGCHPTLSMFVKHGVLAWPCLWGLGSFARLFYFDARMKSGKDSWKLVMMAVSRSSQGQGIGTIVLKEALKFIEDSATQRPYRISLDTQRAINLTFYGKQGFTVSREMFVENSFLGLVKFQSWDMVKVVE
jgi:GNAT superfamily N-acetyltransferase